MNKLNKIDVVAAMIIRGDCLLLAQRGPAGDQAGLWEFPGGKVEPDETQPQALKRELLEELGIHAKIGHYIASESREVSGKIINLHAWQVTEFHGEPEATCHCALVWCLPTEALRYPLAPADIPLLEAFIATSVI